jgi:hypothetical protein
MNPTQKASEFENALTEVAEIAKRIGGILDLKADAQQACFATILISADRNGLLFGLANKELPANGHSEAAKADAQAAAKADAQIKDVSRNPTPEQAEAAQRKVLMGSIKSACLLLNQEGLTPALSNTPKNGKPSTLDAYIEKETQLGKTFAEFDNDDLEALIKNLSFKLDAFRANKKALA